MNISFNTETFRGLNDEEVIENRKQFGFNELNSSKPKTLWSIIFGVFKEPMFLLLVACGTIYLILGDISEGLMLMGFVFVMMGIEFFQERKTEKALDALKDLASPRALVIRNGEEIRIAGKEVVINDLVVLQEGDRVPADGVILHSVNLKADESLLTGESVPVDKIEWDGILEESVPGGDNLPFVYSGSLIVQGTAIYKVRSIGMNTQIGKIGKSIEEVKEEPTKLSKEMGVLIKRIAIIGVILFALVVILFSFTREGGDLRHGFLAGITLAMAMLPEEFPVVLTVFLAIGAWRISKKNVLTRKPAAIETLGAATVLCTDKTGTLTQNKMTISQLYNGNELLKVDKHLNEEFHEIIEYGILSSQTTPFDPMEKAITNIGDEYLRDTEHIHSDWNMLKEYPLSKELLAMSRVFKNTITKKLTIASKGAPEAIFDLCHLDELQIAKHSDAVSKMADCGLRVIGVAKAIIDDTILPEAQHDFDFEFIGLIGLSDPIRDTVPGAVQECYRAGIRVIMITGDYPITAKNIAKQIGLSNYNECISGTELNQMSEDELAEKIKYINVFARVIPEQKLKIVNALKKNKEIVAMTGDGVNDAPALKSANIGIAMGEKGTDVAREASSLVLMDDNFSSIVSAVRMGRRIFDNLQKALGYIFAIHVPIAALSLIPIIFGKLPLLLWPVHIVFLELIIDPACSIIFEAEKEEKNVMNRPPHKSDTSFFGTKKILMACLQGVSILAMVMLVYYIGYEYGLTVNQLRTVSFIALIAGNIGVIQTNRSWNDSIFKIILTPNHTVKWVIGGAIFFLILALEVPFLNKLFKFDGITVLEGIVSAIIGFASIIWFEITKLFNKKNKIPLN